MRALLVLSLGHDKVWANVAFNVQLNSSDEAGDVSANHDARMERCRSNKGQREGSELAHSDDDFCDPYASMTISEAGWLQEGGSVENVMLHTNFI